MGAEGAGWTAQERGRTTLDGEGRGPGDGGERGMRERSNSGWKSRSIRDVTPIAHNGCRPPKRRRV